jgi:predicted ThiF/HesA family dinucleotide-utilizing enzyme
MSDTFNKCLEFVRPAYLVAANVKFDAGDIVCIDTSSGYATPGASAANLLAKGLARKAVDNTGGAAGAAKVEVELFLSEASKIKAFKVVTDAAPNNVTQASVGKRVFVKDAKTVTTDSTGRSATAEVFRIDTDGNPFVIFNQMVPGT